MKHFLFFIFSFFAYSQNLILSADSFPEIKTLLEAPSEISNEEVHITENEVPVRDFYWNLTQQITSEDNVAVLFLTDASGNVSDVGKELFHKALKEIFASPRNFFDEKTQVGFAYFRRADASGKTLKEIRGFVSDFSVLQGIETRIVYDSLYQSDLYKAMYEAADKLKKTPAKIKVLVLLTAGRNDSPSPLTKEDIIKKFKRERVLPLIFVYNESSYAGDDLQPVADLTQGEFYRVKDSRKIVLAVRRFLKNLHKQPDVFIYEAGWISLLDTLPPGSEVHLKLEAGKIQVDTSYVVPIRELPKETSFLEDQTLIYILSGIGGVALLLVFFLILYSRKKQSAGKKSKKESLLKTVISDVPEDTYNVEIITSSMKTVIPLTGKHSWSIGRSSENDIVIGDVTVSKRHARLILIDGKLYIEDLGSTNGIILNSEKVSRSPLKKGDLLKLGETMLKIK